MYLTYDELMKIKVLYFCIFLAVSSFKKYANGGIGRDNKPKGTKGLNLNEFIFIFPKD